jgi:hypothetical protein
MDSGPHQLMDVEFHLVVVELNASTGSSITGDVILLVTSLLSISARGKALCQLTNFSEFISSGYLTSGQ